MTPDQRHARGGLAEVAVAEAVTRSSSAAVSGSSLERSNLLEQRDRALRPTEGPFDVSLHGARSCRPEIRCAAASSVRAARKSPT
jgi:hypothetical protein